MGILIVVEFFFPRFWFEVEESEEWVCKLFGFIWVVFFFFLIAMDSETRLLLLLLYGKTGVC